MVIFSSREVNQDFGRAKKATAKGPVIITDRGRPAHVLLSIEEYRDLSESSESVVDGLASDDTANLDSCIPNRGLPTRKVILE